MNKYLWLGLGGLLGLLMAACRSDSVPRPTYALTVIQGEGSGAYAHGSVVPIRAVAALPGLAFEGWSGDTQWLNDSLAAETELIMPDRAVSLRGRFADTNRYALTVLGGWGDGFYPGETEVAIGLDSVPTGFQFSHWQGDTQLVADPWREETSLRMSYGAVTVEAAFVALPTYPLVVIKGSGSGAYLPGSWVDVEAHAAPTGERFIRWGGEIGDLKSFTRPRTRIQTQARETSIEARFRSDTLPAFSYRLDVAPLMAAHCNSCHYEGGEYSDLTHYDGVYAYRQDISTFIKNGYMPVSPTMNAEEKAVLIEWISRGAIDN